MTTLPRSEPSPPAPKRWALWGFIIGAAITVPATLFALASTAGEALHPYLVPGAVLLAPISDAMASWPGLVNVTIAAVANGVVYAAAAGAVALVLGLRPGR